nr:hypothetical protein [uncultured Oscillibacter sp.]
MSAVIQLYAHVHKDPLDDTDQIADVIVTGGLLPTGCCPYLRQVLFEGVIQELCVGICEPLVLSLNAMGVYGDGFADEPLMSSESCLDRFPGSLFVSDVIHGLTSNLHGVVMGDYWNRPGNA